ncbi:DUF72 domain-containing protein [Halochromatium sp.]
MEQLSLLDGLEAGSSPDSLDAAAGRDGLSHPSVSVARCQGDGAFGSDTLASNGQDSPPARNELPAAIPAATPSTDIQQLASALGNGLGDGLYRGLYLGTSSWSFPGWSGLIYGAPTDKAKLSQRGLPAYAKHPLLRSVGIDSGFYAPLDASRLSQWAEQVPVWFRFVVKAPALITDRHRRAARGRPVGLNPSFLDPSRATEVAVKPYQEGLGTKAGVLLWQFPPLSGAERMAPRRFAEALYRFLIRLPKGPTYAVEVRDANLLTPDLAAALHHGGAVPGLALHPRLPPLPQQLALFADAADDGPLMIRWLLRRNHGYDEARAQYAPFDRLCEPDPESRAQIASAIVAAQRQQRPVFVIVNNKAEGSAPLSLIELARSIAAKIEASGALEGQALGYQLAR